MGALHGRRAILALEEQMCQVNQRNNIILGQLSCPNFRHRQNFGHMFANHSDSSGVQGDRYLAQDGIVSRAPKNAPR
jgi:hypothetical protein